MHTKLTIGLVLVGCALLSWLIAILHHQLLRSYEQSGALSDIEYSWFFLLLLNFVGYAIILVPGLVLYKYLDRTKYFDSIANSTWLSRGLFACFGEPGERLPESSATPEGEGGAAREGAELAFCFVGLMGAYLVWGLLQEKIMTQKYTMSDGSVVRFNDSQFLVFLNRAMALAAAAAQLAWSRRPLVAAPLHKFSYCSLSNVVSTWCQYEALKYVSFPMQVLSKSCKVIPVMMMGRLVSRNKYELYEYVTAALISVGMVLFMFGSHDHYTTSLITTGSGLVLLCVYMVSDSFTSSWQAELFARYRCSSQHMLCAVNLCSCALTLAALLPHARRSLAMLQNPVFVVDCLLLCSSSTIGQLLIYRTIKRFGAVLFTIIMSLRQAVSILVSCAVFGHRVSASGAAGVLLVFLSVSLRVYCRQRVQRRTKQPAA